jgi:hypothetical protein
MARPSRTKLEHERDLELIAHYYLSGRTQAEFAKHLKVSRQQIGYDLKVLQKRWQASALQKIDQAKSEQLAKIDNLEREYWRAWRRSCRDKETKTAERASGADRDRTKAVSRQERRDGNPAFLAGVQWCIEQRSAILGLNATKRVAIHLIEEIHDILPPELREPFRAVFVGAYGSEGAVALAQEAGREPPTYAEIDGQPCGLSDAAG